MEANCPTSRFYGFQTCEVLALKGRNIDNEYETPSKLEYPVVARILAASGRRSDRQATHPVLRRLTENRMRLMQVRSLADMNQSSGTAACHDFYFPWLPKARFRDKCCPIDSAGATHAGPHVWQQQTEECRHGSAPSQNLSIFDAMNSHRGCPQPVISR